ncbi:MAG: hypothetical protein ACC628_17315 [Pirellulaceae bacterium]
MNGERLNGQQAWWDGPQIETFSNRRTNVVAIVARSKAEQPGLIGVIRAGGRTYVTKPDGWSTVPAPKTLNSEWLVDPGKGASQPVQLMDLGVLGVPPWGYVPGEFLGTGARWIWPDTKSSDPDQRWLFRFQFEVP